MDFSFVGSGNSLKRKATSDPEQPSLARPATAVGPSGPFSAQPPLQGQAAPRSIVQLPSLHQVQAAQQPQTAPNLFRATTTSQALQQAVSGSSQPTRAQSSSWANTARPDVSLPVQPNSALQGSGVFAQQPKPTSYQQQPGGLQWQPSAAAHAPFRPLQQQQQHQPAPTYAYVRPAGPRPSQQLASQQQAAQSNPNAIFVNKRQEGNPVLKHIRNVRWQFADIVPDYQLGQNACAVFLSLRFHLLKPEYVHHRIKELQRSYRLRVLVCHIDVEDVVEPLGQVIRAALLNDMTLICGWSPEECARYLETYKSYETKPADVIQGRMDEDYLSRLTSALTTVRGVNKTDVLTLGAAFKTAAGIMKASVNQLAACPGIGPTKVKRLHEVFHEPFRRAPDSRRAAKQAQLAFAASQATGSDLPGITAAQEAGASEAAEQAAADAVEALDTTQPLLEDRVLQTVFGDNDNEPDDDFELDL